MGRDGAAGGRQGGASNWRTVAPIGSEGARRAETGIDHRVVSRWRNGPLSAPKGWHAAPQAGRRRPLGPRRGERPEAAPGTPCGPPGPASADQAGCQIDRRLARRRPGCFPLAISILPAGVRTEHRVAPAPNELRPATRANLSPISPATTPVAQPAGARTKRAVAQGDRLAAARARQRLVVFPRHVAPWSRVAARDNNEKRQVKGDFGFSRSTAGTPPTIADQLSVLEGIEQGANRRRQPQPIRR